MPTAFAKLRPEIHRELVQGIIPLRKMAQSIETATESWIPLASSDMMRSELKTIAKKANEIGQQLKEIYELEAKAAFGES